MSVLLLRFCSTCHRSATSVFRGQFSSQRRHMSAQTPDAWKPQQYQLFSDVRTRPGLELLARIPHVEPCQRVVDLGCGTGRFTVPLAQRFPSAAIIGADTSPAMIKSATATIQATKDQDIIKRVSFTSDSAENWTASPPVDVLYSNAALHWLPDHETLIPHLLKQVRKGGYFAWEIPDNFGAPSHTIMYDLIFEGGYHQTDEMKTVLSGWPHCLDDPLVSYYNLMAPHASMIDAWTTEYCQVLTGPELNDGKNGENPVFHPVLEFTKGSSFSPVLEALPSDADRLKFQLEYTKRLAKSYPIRPHINGDAATIQTLFPFKRHFFVAQRK